MTEHDEEMVRKLFDKRGYAKELQDEVISKAKNEGDVANVAIYIEKCEDDYNKNFENSMKKKENMMKLKNDINKLKEKINKYD